MVNFNWRTNWYPVTFLVDLPADKPYGFSIFAEPLVIFRDKDGDLVCLSDICPHRLAKLSDGQLIEGRLECLYHGWQFGKHGSCLHIPQLPEGGTIPERATVKSFPVQEQQGIIWVWMDVDTPPHPALAPTLDSLEKEGVFIVDTATDLPFDHTFLVENLLDPAHVYISHDGTELGISRKDAKPLEMEILSTSVSGIEGRFRRADKPDASWTSLTFSNLILVQYSFDKPAYHIVGGLALYALPVDYGRSRILVRRYGNFYKLPFTLKPRWLEHLRQNKILEEDLAFIVAQDRFFQNTGKSIQGNYFPIKTCDTFVMEHRRWLDNFGQDLPWYVGLTTSKLPNDQIIKQSSSQLDTRFKRHTQHCNSCGGTYQWLNKIYLGGQLIAVVTLCLSVTADDFLETVSSIIFVLAVIAIIASKTFKTKLEI